LAGADLPSGDYAIVLMTTTASGSDWLPCADLETTRQVFLKSVAEQLETGCGLLFVPVQSLGQAQEAYAALVMAQRAGAFPDLTVYLMDLAAKISEKYAAMLGKVPGPWKTAFAVARDDLPTRGIVVLPEAGDRLEKTIPEEGKKSTILQMPAVFTHAGLGEQLAFAVGVKCSQLMVYHGFNHSLDIVLQSLGRTIIFQSMEK
jgi:hypothetical protein